VCAACDRHRTAAPHKQAGTVAFHDWDDLLAGDAPAARAAVDARIAGIGRDDLACIIYTSGTGGAPRGVMQHHGAILRNVDGAARSCAEDFGWDDEVFLSFLPLSHAYEHTGGQFCRSGWARRSITPKGWKSWPPTSRKCARRSWSWCRACSKCCAPGSSSRWQAGQGRRYLMDRALGIGDRKAAGAPPARRGRWT
jgi:long-chain acyl-CoA synthetase